MWIHSVEHAKRRKVVSLVSVAFVVCCAVWPRCLVARCRRRLVARCRCVLGHLLCPLIVPMLSGSVCSRDRIPPWLSMTGLARLHQVAIVGRCKACIVGAMHFTLAQQREHLCSLPRKILSPVPDFVSPRRTTPRKDDNARTTMSFFLVPFPIRCPLESCRQLQPNQ